MEAHPVGQHALSLPAWPVRVLSNAPSSPNLFDPLQTHLRHPDTETGARRQRINKNPPKRGAGRGGSGEDDKKTRVRTTTGFGKTDHHLPSRPGGMRGAIEYGRPLRRASRVRTDAFRLYPYF